jgi:hypothetical protein
MKKALIHIPQISISFWRRLTNFWTLAFFATIIYDFIYDNVLDEKGVILGVAAIYAACLAIYSAEKEFKRWKESRMGVHPGEVYIILWTILIITIVTLDLVLDKHYKLPPEVSSTYVVVLGILAITKESKFLFRGKSKKK